MSISPLLGITIPTLLSAALLVAAHANLGPAVVAEGTIAGVAHLVFEVFLLAVAAADEGDAVGVKPAHGVPSLCAETLISRLIKSRIFFKSEVSNSVNRS